MARVLLFVALALCASAVVADFIYDNDQVLQLNRRIGACLRVVKPFSDFDRPAAVCRFKGIDKLFSGAAKEAVTSVVVACLHIHKVAADAIHAAEVCLKQKMAEPV